MRYSTSHFFILLSFLVLTACGQQKYISPFERQVSSAPTDNNSNGESSTREPQSSEEEVNLTDDRSISLYEKVLRDSDIKEDALNNAFQYFDDNHQNISNQKWITIFDIGMHSGKKRFYMINMSTGDVKKFHSAHGKNSDTNHDGYATSFSNVNGSNKSSLGFMLTGNTYYGKWGRSMKLDGLEAQNSNVYERFIVIHGADYVNANFSKMGRSLGCPALPLKDKDWIITQIKSGSLFYTYHENFE